MPVSRRDFVTGALASMLATTGCAVRDEVPRASINAFPAGIASGDPTHDSVVLWTHAPPVGREPGQQRPVAVRWFVASDDELGTIVQSGTVLAHAGHGYCVHVDVDGLLPATGYWYWFETEGRLSALGRTKTLPEPGQPCSAFTFALVSCQDYSAGYFTAYRDIAERRPDLIIHVGDYIYETAGGSVRPGLVDEPVTLDDYRNLYLLYRSDPDLQRARAELPWLQIWDDHEVVNDWGRDHYLPSHYNKALPIETYPQRKADAQRAFAEFTPLSRRKRELLATRGVRDRRVIGDLIELNFLDVRQFRDPPVCELDEKNHFRPCEDVHLPDRSMLGHDQERWLQQRFGQSQCRWNGLVQATVMAPIRMTGTEELKYEADAWDNYAAARERLVSRLAAQAIPNLVSFAGNIHAYYAGTYPASNDSPGTAITELVTTSITARGGGQKRYDSFHRRHAGNSMFQFFDNRHRGYLQIEVTHEAILATPVTVAVDTRHRAAVASLPTWRVASGAPGITTDEAARSS